MVTAALTRVAKILGGSAIALTDGATQKRFRVQRRKLKRLCATCCTPLTLAITFPRTK
jgi:hypothetical protein